MYVICPLSYSRCAISIVFLTDSPSSFLDVLCNDEVMNGFSGYVFSDNYCIYKSTDGGYNWNTYTDGLENNYIYEIIII